MNDGGPDRSGPSAVIVRTEAASFGTACEVTLTEEGIGWDPGTEDGVRWVPWPLVGGFADRAMGRTAATDVLALDGSSLGTIKGLAKLDGDRATLAHVVVTFRPDLFVAVDGDRWGIGRGCLRREVAGAPDVTDE
jgi:hypothetical protein